MAKPDGKGTPGWPTNVRDKNLSAAYAELRAEEPPPSQSRYKSYYEERAKKNSQVIKENLEPKEDAGLHKDHLAKDSEVEVEPAASTSANAADNGDNGSVDSAREETVEGGHDGQFLESAHEAAVEGDREDALSNRAHGELSDSSRGDQPLDGTCDELVESGHDIQSLGSTHEAAVEGTHGDKSYNSTHEEPSNGNRSIESLDATCEEPVVGKHQEPFEGTREGTAGHMCKEADGSGTPVQKITKTSEESVPGKHDEPPNSGGHEATVAGTPQDSGSHHEHEGPSEPRPKKRNWIPLPGFQNMRPTL